MLSLSLVMTPRARPPQTPPNLVQLRPEDEARLRVVVAQSEKDEGRALTPEELRHWAETGEWPDS
jgi:hypothetical protein